MLVTNEGTYTWKFGDCIHSTKIKKKNGLPKDILDQLERICKLKSENILVNDGDLRFNIIWKCLVQNFEGDIRFNNTKDIHAVKCQVRTRVKYYKEIIRGKKKIELE